MSFSNRLPKEADGRRFGVIAPVNGLRSAIDEVIGYLGSIEENELSGVDRSTHMDLQVIWEYSRLQIRIFLISGELEQNLNHPSVYMIGGALGVLLDKAGRETSQHIHVSGWLTTEPETVGTIAGMLTIESLSNGIGSEAS